MKILALDTSTETCSVALLIGGELIESAASGVQHSSKILPMAEALLAQADIALAQLDTLAFGRGPGLFTGLRIGAGVVQGLAFALELPVVPVSSLAALAHGIDARQVLAALDARMGQVYWGAYERRAMGRMVLEGQERVLAPGAVPMPSGRSWIGAGSGWDEYDEVLTRRLGDAVTGWQSGAHPRARDVARLATEAFRNGEAVAPEHAVPVYLRDNVAKKMAVD